MVEGAGAWHSHNDRDRQQRAQNKTDMESRECTYHCFLGDIKRAWTLRPGRRLCLCLYLMVQ